MKIVKKWEILKRKYYEEREQNKLNDEWYEKIREEFDLLKIKVPETIITDIGDTNNEPVHAFFCPEDFRASMAIYIIRCDENIELYQEKLMGAVLEYYKHYRFYDAVAGYSLDDLVSIVIREYEIPIVAYFNPKKNKYARY